MGKKHKKTRHAGLSDLKAVLAYRNRPEPVIEPVQTNWTTVAANDNNPEDLDDFRVERRLEITPSLQSIIAEMRQPEIKNAANQTVSIGSLRFSDGTQTERAYCYGADGKLLQFDARLPVGAMLGTKEKADALAGSADDATDITQSNHYFADVLNAAPFRYVSGARDRKKGKSYSQAESASELAKAYANTPVLPAIKRLPPGLPCATRRVADSFIGMQKITASGGGSIAWEDLATAMVNRQTWRGAISTLRHSHKRTLDKAMAAENIAELSPKGYRRAASYDKGRKRLQAANDSLLRALEAA